MNLRAEIKPELWNTISKCYESEIYSNAILEAIHYLSNVLRERANVDGDGASLVGQALGGDNPRLRINKFQTETEKNAQKGLEQMLRGLYQGIRNPRSHEQFEDNQATANAIILFIDFILGIISEAKEPFTLEEWSERVFDSDFVASDRYAKLLASEVPPKKYTDALITIYREKMSGDGENLQYIFRALIGLVGDDNLEDFLSVVSAELKTTQEDLVIKMVLQILPERLWPRIDESARLRIENKLIRSIKSGNWLATWARNFIKFFMLKNDAYWVLLKKLQGDEEDQNYIAEFFMWILPDSLDQTDDQLWNECKREAYIEAIVQAVCKPVAPNFMREKLLEIYNLPSDWQDLILEGIKPLKESDAEYYAQVVKKAKEDDF